MIRTIITGSAGRMGKALVAAIAANPEFRLAGATEYPASPLIGQDAGTVAGVAALDVPISASLTHSRPLWGVSTQPTRKLSVL